MKQTLQKREQRAKLASDFRKLLDQADAEKRALTAEEREQCDRIEADIDRLGREVEAEEDQERRSRLASVEATLAQPARTILTPPPAAVEKFAAKNGVDPAEQRKQRFERRSRRFGKAVAYSDTPEYRGLFRSYLRGGFGKLNSAEVRAYHQFAEYRALQADADVQGGYLIPPMQLMNRLILFLKDFVFIRQLATVVPVTNAQSLGVPSLDADPADADWTSELATGAEDSTMAFGRRELTPHPLAKRIKLSNKLLRLSPSVDNLVMDRLGYKFAVTEEKGFLTGSGSQRPLGLFTASAQGISTGRDVSTGNTTTAIQADGIYEAFYNLKAQYQMSRSTAWLFSRAAVKQVRKLKDGVGQYLWQPGLQASQPDELLGKPVYMSEYVPSTFTTGLYVGMIGDFSFYWIAESLSMTVQRLEELYAETNQVGFIGRRELDGMPVLEEAFSRVKLA